MNPLHAVKDRERDPLKRLAPLFAAHIALADGLCAGKDIRLEVVLHPENFMLLRILIGDAVAKRHTRSPEQRSVHHLHDPLH